MTYYDVTVPLQADIPVWTGDEQPKIERVTSLNRGDLTNTSRIQCSLHTGTHVDAPRHLFEEGESVEELPLNILIGPATVLELTGVDIIDAAVLQRLSLSRLSRILFKTRNSGWWRSPRHRFHTDFVSLTVDAAEFLVEQQVQLIGIDYLSIDLYNNEDLTAHKTLLGNKIVVIEGLDLHEVPPGNYELFCLPLKVVGADGAPARVILRGEG